MLFVRYGTAAAEQVFKSKQGQCRIRRCAHDGSLMIHNQRHGMMAMHAAAASCGGQNANCQRQQQYGQASRLSAASAAARIEAISRHSCYYSSTTKRPTSCQTFSTWAWLRYGFCNARNVFLPAGWLAWEH